MKNKNFYITTPIYYVNDSPHIGHAYTTLACDVLARFKRLDGFNVYFLTGTDEHGQKVEKAAKAKNLDPQQFTDKVSKRFYDLAKLMNYSNDDFIRTTQERHKKAAQAIWQRLQTNGYIYLDKYEGWYSVRDEAYYPESELINGKTPGGAEVEWVEEPSYFFRLSAFQDRLLNFYEENPGFVYPRSRMNEVINFVKGGKTLVTGALKDLSISRTTFSWGVPVPDDEKHVMYVWLDALVNYISALGFPNEEAPNFKTFWLPQDQPQNNNDYIIGNAIHMVGKDILRFHAIYWPAFLIAANLPLPKKIVAHGWWTNEGEKISKSLGNVIDPLKLVEEFGLDQVRYFLLKEVPFGQDGNYSRQGMITRINAELANTIGNLAQRSLSIIAKNFAGVIPEQSTQESQDKELLQLAYNHLETLRTEINSFAFDQALETILALAHKANEYIDMQAPWNLKKQGNITRMGQVLYTLCETIRCIAISLQPFIPNSANKILDQLSIPQNARNFSYLNKENALKPGTVFPPPQGVFPRFVGG